MIFTICPTCGAELSHKQIIYEDKMKEICTKLKINYDMISSGILDNNEEFKKQRADLVMDLCDKICCKGYMITYVRIVDLIK
ncbi:hypothetical protein BMW23_0548 [Bodo saltans virus]|uniref:Uncharacterized protein n=1 Tax=Bodo saltans virus TaxID=2024608 RepID=A0A2H4UUT9_9VIRU|nr:hypothetical protein QJ851_gp0532 [Bodo saltans virus]ATZ80595.1 hypothetical protein BMW23_0548 [Bodo saltans virus]